MSTTTYVILSCNPLTMTISLLVTIVYLHTYIHRLQYNYIYKYHVHSAAGTAK